METSDTLRHQIVRSLTTQHVENVVDAELGLWEQMATQIISIVGEGGFNSLYARSLFLTRAAFPWLATGSPSPQAEHRFAELKQCLDGQTPAQARAANRLLLITFTDILAALIGELLTTRILRAAWRNDISDKADKEFKNE
jgi:hypothetical protein